MAAKRTKSHDIFKITITKRLYIYGRVYSSVGLLIIFFSVDNLTLKLNIATERAPTRRRSDPAAGRNYCTTAGGRSSQQIWLRHLLGAPVQHRRHQHHRTAAGKMAWRLRMASPPVRSAAMRSAAMYSPAHSAAAAQSQLQPLHLQCYVRAPAGLAETRRRQLGAAPVRTAFSRLPAGKLPCTIPVKPETSAPRSVLSSKTVASDPAVPPHSLQRSTAGLESNGRAAACVPAAF